METFDNSEQIDRRFQAIDSTTYGEIAFRKYEPFSVEGEKGQGSIGNNNRGQEKGQGHKFEGGVIEDIDEYARKLDEDKNSSDK